MSSSGLVPTLPFTRRQARASGITDAQLRGGRFRQLLRGIHVDATIEMTAILWMRAALLASPADAVVSHRSALLAYGLDLGPVLPVHVSTRTRTHSRHPNIQAHQRRAPIASRTVRGVRVTSPLRTLVDLATKVTVVELVQAAETLVHRGLVDLEQLGEYAVTQHLDGVQRLRRVLGWIREDVESPRETILRLMIVFARLPEPRCNHVIRDATGAFIGRGDLVYPDLRVVIEYDGWYHERSSGQRQHDLLRRERLEAAGWRVIVVTAQDVKDPEAVVGRVHSALVARGLTTATPTFSTMWKTWFPTEDPQHRSHDVGTCGGVGVA